MNDGDLNAERIFITFRSVQDLAHVLVFFCVWVFFFFALRNSFFLTRSAHRRSPICPSPPRCASPSSPLSHNSSRFIPAKRRDEPKDVWHYPCSPCPPSLSARYVV